MNSDIRQLLEAVKSGETSVDDALLEIKKAPFEDIGYAKVDLHRKIRQGAAEVIYGAGKTPEQIAGIISAMLRNGQERILVTRMTPEAAEFVGKIHPLDYRKDAKVGIVGTMPEPSGIGNVVIATGGTSDIPVAEEAALTAEILGSRVVRLYDVGVSGVHRLLGRLPRHCGSHQRGLRSVLWRRFRAAEHAQFLRQRCVRGEYRQRFRRRLSGQYDQPYGG